MISIKKCKELLGEKAKKYTDEQIELLRKYLLKMAKLNVEIINNQKRI